MSRLLLVIACACGSPQSTSAPVAARTNAAPVEQPRPKKMVITETHVEALDPIRFVGLSSNIDPASVPILDAIASTLSGNPGIKLVGVRAYGQDGIAQFQQTIGEARAREIVDQLIKRGIDPKRLIAEGMATSPNGNPMPILIIWRRDP